MSKNPSSYRLPIPKGKIETTDMADSRANPIPAPTPVECIKYGIPLEKAKIMHIKDLTLDDYMYLRKSGELKKQAIKGLYGFPGDATFYKKMKDIGAFPEPVFDGDVQIPGIAEIEPVGLDIVELSEIAEQILIIEPEPTIAVADPAPVNPQKLSIITKHICPTCLDEYDVLSDAETCLNGHAWVVGIVRADGLCAFNCPPFIYVNMSDGREMKYVAYGYEED